MERITTVAALRRRIARHRAAGASIGLVPTMGALHEGHLELVRRLAEHVDTLVVSVFVNPTQFDRADDLAAYPRDLERDEAALRGLGAATPALVFVPAAEEVYPTDLLTTVVIRGGLTEGLCGVSRPGHFDAVATMVAKLLNMVGPDIAAFGRKDRQQLQVVRRMVADLDMPVTILDVPTVREADGLALSSRNRLLDPRRREQARALPEALAASVCAARRSRARDRPVTAGQLRAAAEEVLTSSPGIGLDYLEVVSPETMQPAEESCVAPRLLVALAADLGGVRLIDNVEIGDLGEEEALLAATSGAPILRGEG